MIKYDKSYQSLKDLKLQVFGHSPKKSEGLDMRLKEKAHTEDYYETTGSGETTIPYDVDNHYESSEQTDEQMEGKVMYLDPIMFYNLILDGVKEQQVRQKQDLQHHVDMIVMYKKPRDDPAIGDYKEIESVHDAMNVLLGRNADVRNSFLEKQMETERRRDGKDNAILYELARNNHKFMKHYYLDRYADMQNMFLMKQVKNDGNVQQSAYDTKRNTNELMNALFDDSAKNMPQTFQNKRFNFFKVLFLHSGKQKNDTYEVMANYHERNDLNKNENIIDRDIFKLKKNEDKGSIDEKKEILFNFGKIEEKDNISDVEKKDDFLSTEEENDKNESREGIQIIESGESNDR